MPVFRLVRFQFMGFPLPAPQNVQLVYNMTTSGTFCSFKPCREYDVGSHYQLPQSPHSGN